MVEADVFDDVFASGTEPGADYDELSACGLWGYEEGGAGADFDEFSHGRRH